MVQLDCPGRYEIAEDSGHVTVTLADAGPDACAAVGRKVNDGSAVGWPQLDATAVSIRPTKELPAAVSALLPDALRAGWVADVNYAGEMVSGTTVWETGPFPRRVAGFDLTVGRRAAWQALRFFVEDRQITLRTVPVRFPAATLRDAVGQPVELATWATIGWTAMESWLSDIIPVNLPDSRACGAHIAAGTLALIQTNEAPDKGQRACRRPPSSPPDTVYIGPDWVYLDWDVVPAALWTTKREPPNPNDWRAETDDGCDIVCR